MSGKRDLFARRRRELGYSQEKLAADLGVATSTVTRWECGRADPHPQQRPRLAALLEVTAPELDGLLNPPFMAPVHRAAPAVIDESDDMKRREALGLIAATALITFPFGEAAAAPVAFVPSDDSGILANAHLWRTFSASRNKHEAYPLVRHRLGVLTAELRSVTSERARNRLCGLIGDLYQLAGEVLFDSNRYTDAAQCYTLAAAAAREAAQYDLWASALARHAFVELSERRYDSAEAILTAASRIAHRGDNRLSTRHWVAAVQAQAFAGLGLLQACDRALAEAEQVRGLTGPVQNGGWLRFDGSRLAEERGTCYLVLGRPDLAEKSLLNALKTSHSPRRRGSVLAELAVLSAHNGDIEQVVHFGSASLALAGETGSGYIAKKLGGVRPHLAPLLKDDRIADLHHHLSALQHAA
ncbi:helix-turn-helix domain-containing protein [Streptomyces sp. NRRL S-350]|uniref:helix-turn-helix domain-containing protein n=1 Tax=Streptomyces sp. NRRL S-350 TaxID=1463902 RepID=UPI0004C179B6|nr:helix-turn-helix transcriptional regulator [Streptomyces sp. NRRL S-350]